MPCNFHVNINQTNITSLHMMRKITSLKVWNVKRFGNLYVHSNNKLFHQLSNLFIRSVTTATTLKYWALRCFCQQTFNRIWENKITKFTMFFTCFVQFEIKWMSFRNWDVVERVYTSWLSEKLFILTYISVIIFLCKFN